MMTAPSMHSKRPRTNAEMTSRDFAVDGSARLRPHAEALHDVAWVNNMRAAVMHGTVQGKVVLDVSAGLGFWSMLAAREGAQHVYSIEPTCLANQLRQCVRDNGLVDKITVYQCEVDRDLRLPVEQVDVIIAPWALQAKILQHSVVDRVLFARDRFLAADGIILPNKLKLYVYGVSDDPATELKGRENEARWWSSVYGFDMSCMAPPTFRSQDVPQQASHTSGNAHRTGSHTSKINKVPTNRIHRIVAVEEQNICTKPWLLNVLDLMECETRDLSFSRQFLLDATVVKGIVVTGVLLDFDVTFDHAAISRQQLLVYGRTTAPSWRSMVMDLDVPIDVPKDRKLCGKIRCTFTEAPFSAPPPRSCRWTVALSKSIELSDAASSAAEEGRSGE
eukprot:m.1522983 g.1522983  ORF g.1522983 m.1522983 type:complete len:391 (+) comp25231_c0_seq3:356-1528(+)